MTQYEFDFMEELLTPMEKIMKYMDEESMLEADMYLIKLLTDTPI